MSDPNAYCQNGVGFPELLHLTVPYNMNFLQANGVFFSMLPVALMIFFFFVFLFTRKFSFIILFSLGCLASGVNQFILKPMKEETRPEEGCLKDSDGFPSGHSVNALGVWAFITLHELTNYRASVPRKIVLCLLYFIVFSLNGPARWVVRDHTPVQIAVGCAAGAIWGTVVWLFFRFIFQKFLLEKFMCTKFARWIRLMNDLDPEFRRSKHQGEKYRAKMSELQALGMKSNERTSLIGSEDPLRDPSSLSLPSKRRTIFVHAFSVLIQVLLGVLGLIVPYYQADVIDPNCKRADVGLVISMGSFTLGIALCISIVTFLVHRKLTGNSWFPLILKGSLLVAGTLLTETAWYVYLIVSAVKKQRCEFSEKIPRTEQYAIAWAAVQLAMVIIWLIAFRLLRLPRLYGNPKLVYPVNGGIMPTAF